MDLRDIIEYKIKPNIPQPLWESWYIKEKIGSGSFSVVYRIEAQRADGIDEAALKVEAITADGQLFSDSSRKNSFLNAKKKMATNETRIMKNLRDCPYIIRYEEELMRELYIDGNFEGYYNLIRMEYLQNVFELMTSGQFDYSEGNVKKLALNIGHGLKAAHDISVIHRDIKPENMFLSDRGIYKLGDFNISKKAVSTRSFAGTYYYMAPEIYRAKSSVEESYTQQADIYSFGLCLYQMMNGGSLPFEDSLDPEAAYDKRMQGDSIKPPKNASPAFSKIILKACAFDSSSRYRSVDEMITELTGEMRNVEERKTQYADSKNNLQVSYDNNITQYADDNTAFDDSDYLAASCLSDPIAKNVHSTEAKYIDSVQKRILEISSKETPYDIFICYKESDEYGNRTIDSVFAQDIYTELIKQGYNVFFSRITLADKLGVEYEPYIWAALNSARIMLVIGTRADYFTAPLLRNEWERFLSMKAQGKDKTLIPCYRNISLQAMPAEFERLQLQDLSKIGYLQDLIRGIKKIIGKNLNSSKNVHSIGTQDVFTLAKCTLIAIKEKKWDKAEEYCGEMIQISPENTVAYLLKIIIADHYNKDVTIYGKHLERYSAYIAEMEKEMFSSENYMEYFWLLAKAGSVSRIKYIFSIHPEIMEMNFPNEHHSIYPLLSYAINTYKNHTTVVKTLLECGISPDSYRVYFNKHGKTRYCVLGDAIWIAKNVEMVKLLLEYGANPDCSERIVYDDGLVGSKSLLTYAICDAKNSEMVRLLLEHGADANSYRIHSNKYGETKYCVLGDAIWVAKNVEMVKLLLEYGANPDCSERIVYDDGLVGSKSLLTYAIVDAKNSEMVRLLLEHGADANSYRICSNKYGETKYCVWNCQEMCSQKIPKI